MNIIYSAKGCDVSFIINSLYAYNMEKVPSIHFGIMKIKDNVWESFLAVSGDGRICGGLVFQQQENIIRIRYFWVDGQCRGQGTGSRLIRKIREETRLRNCGKIVLYTTSFQAPEFYRKQGFRLTELKPTPRYEQFTDYHYEWTNQKERTADCHG